MINPKSFYNLLTSANVEFFSGVPDSLLKDFCAYITDNAPKQNHIIAANEGNAIALAAGHHMATGKIPMVYMQNSGIGNAVNPLLSLADKQVYSIPMLLMIGWRGEPGLKDEPQHVMQGEVTLDLLKAMKIPYVVLSNVETEVESQVKEALTNAKANNAPYALVIKKGTFDKYSIKDKIKTSYELSREAAIQQIVEQLNGDEIIVSTTGKTSRELFEIRAALGQAHHSDFLTVGSMGHASQIALGIALSKPNKKVICIDGDGALLMQMGGLAIIGTMAPSNFIHIVINNGAHESVGGQPTVGFEIDIPALAKANNYKMATAVSNATELKNALKNIETGNCPALIEIKTKVGSRDDLGRPTIKPVDNKVNFMENLQK
ncbi:MAG: phosphonopyruvate decarboxylase [Salinivirgaceae bacterium]|jgi:phosphonopyruvate decarboxylase|nr:phosphonopyruvate decarboxylase [Salinivirgaceae bacterium]